MKAIIFFGCMFLFVVIISFLWANGITKMKEEHPDYKGEDFLDN